MHVPQFTFIYIHLIIIEFFVINRRIGSYVGFSTRIGQQLPNHPQRVAATILTQPQLHCLPLLATTTFPLTSLGQCKTSRVMSKCPASPIIPLSHRHRWTLRCHHQPWLIIRSSIWGSQSRMCSWASSAGSTATWRGRRLNKVISLRMGSSTWLRVASRRCGTHSVNRFIGRLLQLTEDDTKFLGNEETKRRMHE